MRHGGDKRAIAAWGLWHCQNCSLINCILRGAAGQGVRVGMAHVGPAAAAWLLTAAQDSPRPRQMTPFLGKADQFKKSEFNPLGLSW